MLLLGLEVRMLEFHLMKEMNHGLKWDQSEKLMDFRKSQQGLCSRLENEQQCILIILKSSQILLLRDLLLRKKVGSINLQYRLLLIFISIL